MYMYMYVVKTKAVISCWVTAKLILVFVFRYAKSMLFSHDAAQIKCVGTQQGPDSDYVHRENKNQTC